MGKSIFPNDTTQKYNSKPIVYKWWEERKYSVDFGDGVVTYMTKAEVLGYFFPGAERFASGL